MRRFELVGRGEVRLNPDAPVPEVGDGDVLVRVGACTVCNRSDLVYFHYLGLREHCSSSTACFGHEIAGVVERVGGAVTRVRPGQHVFVRTPSSSGFADFAVAREACVGTLPHDVPFEQGAIYQLLPLAVHATRGIELGDRVADVGQGPVGLMALQVARLRGASELVTADSDPWRLERSRSLGADRTVQATVTPAVVAELGDDFDVAIDAVGTPESVTACTEMVRRGGTVVLLGTHHVDTNVTFDLVAWERRGLVVQTAAETTDADRLATIRIAERLIRARRVRVDEMLTHVFPLDELPHALTQLSRSSVLYPRGAESAFDGPPPKMLKVAICP